MKSRASLQVMEQLAMIAVFALAASLCLQAYAAAYRTSLDVLDRDRAEAMADGLVRAFRSGREVPLDGPKAGADFLGNYDENWEPDADGRTSVRVTWTDGPRYAGADVAICGRDGTELASRSAVWPVSRER